MPQDRQGRFSTELFSRYQRGEKALVAALVEMYFQGVSTRKVKAISEELCGHEFGASTISELWRHPRRRAGTLARQRLAAEHPYLILDARYEKVREDGVRLASDDHAGLKRGVAEILPEAAWQRCYVHFLRNALDHLPRKANDDCLTELRWLYDLRDIAEARHQLRNWLGKWAGKHPKLCAWVEEQIEKTWTFYRQPRRHHKHLKSTHLLERLNQEIKHRTHVVRIFPHEQNCLRLIRALAAEQHEEWPGSSSGGRTVGASASMAGMFALA